MGRGAGVVGFKSLRNLSGSYHRGEVCGRDGTLNRYLGIIQAMRTEFLIFS